MKRVFFITKTFGYVRRDITKSEKFTDIELNTTEAKVTWGDLMGVDGDPSEAHVGQTQNTNESVTTRRI